MNDRDVDLVVSEPVQVRIEPELYTGAAILAKINRRSRQSQINDLLADAILREAKALGVEVKVNR